MLLVGAIVGPSITVALALNGWFGGPRRRAIRRATPVPKDVAERLGSELAAFLGATRALHRELVVLEEATRAMLTIEIRGNVQAQARTRPAHEQVDDATFVAHLREVRALGAAWLARHAALERGSALDDVELDTTRLSAWLELPLGLSADHDSKPDRTDELAVVLAAVLGASAALARVDAVLSASPSTVYR